MILYFYYSCAKGFFIKCKYQVFYNMDKIKTVSVEFSQLSLLISKSLLISFYWSLWQETFNIGTYQGSNFSASCFQPIGEKLSWLLMPI